MPTTRPSWHFERIAQSKGFRHVAGVDEAGRGPLAGPVVAAAVIFLPGVRMNGLNDSKLLTHERRHELAAKIQQKALAVGIGLATAGEIDRLNILAATHLAARRAVEGLPIQPDYFITDFLRFEWARAPIEPLVGGDGRCASVAAASILAKVTRDLLMTEYDAEYPGYGFASHKGYATEDHLEALHAHGPSTLHRLTFRGVSWFDAPLRHSRTFDLLREAIAGIVDKESSRSVDIGIRQSLERLPECEREEIRSVFHLRLDQMGIRL